uniref:TMEM248/TMEM219 domain-containing protein n=1 Tax=Nothobranchius pienaari TaxID=704102 RepID=A0A1A8N481_9TELE
MMSYCQTVTNLRNYISHNPPGATFVLCLLTLAISLIYLSSYSYPHNLPNPDIKDWNNLLSSLSEFDLCGTVNSSSPVQLSSTPVPLMDQENDKITSVNLTKSPPPITVLHRRVPLTVSSEGGLLKNTGLLTSLTASQLRLGDKEIVNLTLHILSDISNYSCLTISAPTDILPKSPLPPECPASEKTKSTISVEASNQPQMSSQTCYSLHFEKDPTLAVMLTLEEKDVAVRHLLEVSLCLLSICILLCLAASFTHSSRHHNSYQNGLNLQNEPLIGS